MGPLRSRIAGFRVPRRLVAAIGVAATMAMMGLRAGTPAGHHHGGAEHDAVVPLDSGDSDLEAQVVPLEEGPPPEPPTIQACSERHTVRPAEGSGFVRHSTVPRETLAQIAHRYDVSPWKLREWNGLAAETPSLQKGTRIRVRPRRISPPRERIEYTVRPGDTWWRVAVAHGVDSMDLRAYNWPYRGKMTPGETLQIWIDPLIYDWIRATPGDPLTPEEGVRRGGVGIGSPNDGVLLNGVQIPEGPNYRLRFAKSAYGTTHAVEQFLAAMAVLGELEDAPARVAVGSMSRPRGGPLGTHQSHQTGRDLDLRLPRRAGVPSWQALKPSRVNWLGTWRLVQALARTDVEVIFLDYGMQRRLYQAAEKAGASEEELATLLQYPRGRHARRGLVRHEDGHDKHLHVRFRCGPCETECVVLGAAPPESEP